MSTDQKSLISRLLQAPTYVIRLVWMILALAASFLLSVMICGYEEDETIWIPFLLFHWVLHLIAHWPLAILLFIVGGILTGYFGAGLGLPGLFRDDPDQKEVFWNSRSFWGGFGVALFSSVVWTAIFFCRFIDFQEQADHLTRHQSPEAMSLSAAGGAAQAQVKQPKTPGDQTKASEQSETQIDSWSKWVQKMQLLCDDLYKDFQRSSDPKPPEKKKETEIDTLIMRSRQCLAAAKQKLEDGRRDQQADSLEYQPFSPIDFMAQLYGTNETLNDLEARLKDRILELQNAGAPDSTIKQLDSTIKQLGEIRNSLFSFTMGIHENMLLSQLIFGTLNTLILFLGCYGITTPGLEKRRRSSGQRLVVLHDLTGFVSGGLLSFFFTMTCGFTYILINRRLVRYFGHGSYEDTWLSTIITYSRFQNPMDASAVLVFIVGTTVVFWALLNRFRVKAGLGICMFLCVPVVLYLFLVAIDPGSQFLVVGALAAGLIALNWNPFKYQFPGMEPYYRKPYDLHEEDDNIEREGAKFRPGPMDPSGRPELLIDRAVLDAWALRLRKVHGGRKPKLVLVTATGAAYRASFWTTTVLERLASEPELAGFLNHVRLITGASGGMVGAAYLVAMLEQPDSRTGCSPPVDATERLRTDSGGDSLSAVVRRLIGGDLPRALWPGVQSQDRGRTLEDQWKTLDRLTFHDLRDGEKAGWRPSLVLSPMIVETGRRLLFSNLDLYGLTDTQARNRKTVSIEKEDLDKLAAKGGCRRLSRSAVEFFRGFPEIYRSFQVKVAVRMNASFPYISPAVSLPVDPPRRGGCRLLRQLRGQPCRRLGVHEPPLDS